jgi:ACT domain-containing protein
MKAIISVTGKDNVGIIAGVSTICAEKGANILDITQSVLSEYFAMIMLADISKMKKPFGDFSDEMQKLGEEMGMSVHVMHETIFNSMHRI